MKNNLPSKILVVMLLLALGLSNLIAAPVRAAGTSYYVDCSASSNGDGTQASPWNNLDTVSSFAFNPGDSVLFKRGTTCTGALLFQRAGTSSDRITLGDYGDGALPILNGAGQETTLKLVNPSYVTVQNLEITGSTRWGLLATSNVTTVIEGLVLQNLVVRDVTGGTMDAKFTGLVIVMPMIKLGKFNNVLIDHVTAYNTTMWSGIMVWGIWLEGDMRWRQRAQDPAQRSSNIVIRNSTVHDTYGDGITVYMGNGITLENNVVYRSGQEPTQTIGTPNAIWTWASNNVLVQGNEAYENNSPGADGGAFDVDYWSDSTTIQYNYAHDNSAYCVGIFGAERSTTTNTIVRYNICANNGVENNTDGAEEIYFCTWNHGKLGDVQIYGNTLYTTVRGAVGTCSGVPVPKFARRSVQTFMNNLVVSTVPNVLGAGMANIPFKRDYNLYYYTGGSFTGDEAHSIYNQDPLVNSLGYHSVGRPTTQWTLQAGSPAINAGTDPCIGIPGCTTGGRDFFGGAVPVGAYDIGADEN
ncbi:MAG: right-handed parallel beta-helix repeat-containing protein [Omnitrophica WOR_2 bacterium]